MRVRSFHPFRPVDHEIQDDIPWQDWIVSDGVVDSSGAFKRSRPPGQPYGQYPSAGTDAGGTSSGRKLAPLDDSLIAEILAVRRASATWKACVAEGTSWAGTAEENIEKYVSTVGVDPDMYDPAA